MVSLDRAAEEEGAARAPRRLARLQPRHPTQRHLKPSLEARFVIFLRACWQGPRQLRGGEGEYRADIWRSNHTLPSAPSEEGLLPRLDPETGLQHSGASV